MRFFLLLAVLAVGLSACEEAHSPTAASDAAPAAETAPTADTGENKGYGNP